MSSIYRFVKESASSSQSGPSSSKRLFVQGGSESPTKSLKTEPKTANVGVSTQKKTLITSSYEKSTLSPKSSRKQIHFEDDSKYRHEKSPSRTQHGSPITTIISISHDSKKPIDSHTSVTTIPDCQNLQAIYTKRRLSTEVLGSSLESTKTSRSGENGARRITTRIVRKVTTMTRGEEQSLEEDMIKQAEMHSITMPGYEMGKEVQSKRVKVV